MIDQDTVVLFGIICVAGLIISIIAHKKYALTRQRAYLAVMAIDRCQFLLNRVKALQIAGCDSELVQSFNAYMVTELAKVFALNPDHQEAKDIAVKALVTAEDQSPPEVQKVATREELKKIRQQLHRAFSELPILVSLKIIRRSKLNFWRAHIKSQTAEMELTFHFSEAEAAVKEHRVGLALNHLSRCETIVKKTRFQDNQRGAKWLEKTRELRNPLQLRQHQRSAF